VGSAPRTLCRVKSAEYLVDGSDDKGVFVSSGRVEIHHEGIRSFGLSSV
jgi:hypothetical protein